MALDATVGGTASNSYVTVTEATTYFTDSINKGLWASYAFKDAALIEATRLLNTFVKWKGILIFGTHQALSWPRWWVYDINGFLIQPDVIPLPIKNITYELAYWLIENNGPNLDDNPLNNLTVGPIKLDFNDAMSRPGFPKLVREGITFWGENLLPTSGEARAVHLSRA